MASKNEAQSVELIPELKTEKMDEPILVDASLIQSSTSSAESNADILSRQASSSSTDTAIDDDEVDSLLSDLEDSIGKIDELERVANEPEADAPEELTRVDINLANIKGGKEHSAQINLDDISVEREQRELMLLDPYTGSRINPFTGKHYFFNIEYHYVDLLRKVRDQPTLNNFKELLQNFSRSRIKVYIEIFKKLSENSLRDLYVKVLPLNHIRFNLFDERAPKYFWNIRLEEFGLSQKENYENLLEEVVSIENRNERHINEVVDGFFQLCGFEELSRIFIKKGNEEIEEETLFDKLGLESGEDNDIRTIESNGVVTRKQISDIIRKDLKLLVADTNRGGTTKMKIIANSNEEESRILLKIIFEAQLHKIYYYWANCFMLRKNLSWLQYRKEGDNILNVKEGIYMNQHDLALTGPIVLETCFKEHIINNVGNLNNVRKQISADLLKILVGIDIFTLMPNDNLYKNIQNRIYEINYSLMIEHELQFYGMSMMQRGRKLQEITEGDTLKFRSEGETKTTQIERKKIESIEEDKITLSGGDVITKENYSQDYRGRIKWEDSTLSRKANVNEILLDLLILTRSEYVMFGTSIFLNDYMIKTHDDEVYLHSRVMRVLANNKTKDEKIMNIGKSLRKVLKGQIPGDGYNSIYFPVREPEKGIDLYHDKMGVVAFNADNSRWHNSETCEITGQRFTRTIRKHHCRVCGRTIRDSVSKKRCKLVKVRYSEDDERFIEDGILSGSNRRICDICYSKMSLEEKSRRECPEGESKS